MKRLLPIALVLLFSPSCSNKTQNAQGNTAHPQSIAAKTSGMQAYPGFFNFYWEAQAGKIWLEIDRFDEEFLYVNSLPAGIGSNDIGLDRGQLGKNRVVKFMRVGPKVLLIQPNYKFRAESSNPEEQRSVEEAFAQSVLWGFTVSAENPGKVLVDVTDFLMRDAHDVSGTLADKKQGRYKVELSRSTVYLPKTKNFPENTELDALLTFTGEADGNWIRSVVPSPEAVTVRQHHSFIQLPDDQYQPRVFDPRSGYYSISYADYATPIDQPLLKRFITRHRLQKKNPEAAMSEPVEPIIYYLDRGAPEPVKSALLDGARWWNQAFEAAGYKNAFRVEILPEGIDPMDVRYNVIQWVHRSTRGWSYGSSVTDPRTGEIIKGHVSLGSLRVRQDFLIAQGLLTPYESGKPVSKKMEELALARLRQLSAHEVGHTLGLTHNFAASVDGRTSVMDYPHPYITLDAQGNLDFSNAYDDKIGAWDKRAIIFGYQDFPKEADENKALNDIVQETIEKGFHFIADRDARPAGGAHPLAHLWDNGPDAVAELERLSQVRAKALQKFGENNIPEGRPLSELEEVLVPLYLAHRYQIEAVSKLIGGVEYNYALRGDGQLIQETVPASQQRKALAALIKTIRPEFLKIPIPVLDQLPPKPIGYERSRESFKSRTGLTFDPIAAAESSINATLSLLLHPQRASRLIQQNALEKSAFTLRELINDLLKSAWTEYEDPYAAALQQVVDLLILQHLMHLAADKSATAQATAIALQELENLGNWLEMEYGKSQNQNRQAHLMKGITEIELFKKDPSSWEMHPVKKMPDGSPIGCGGLHDW